MKEIRMVYIVSAAFLVYLFLLSSIALVAPLVIWGALYAFAIWYDLRFETFKYKSYRYDRSKSYGKRR